MGRYLSGLRAAHHRRTLLSGGQSYALKAVLDRCLTRSMTANTDLIADISIEITDIIKAHDTVDWQNNKEIHNRIAQDIDDLFYNLEQKGKLKVELSVVDKIIENVIVVALRRF